MSTNPKWRIDLHNLNSVVEDGWAVTISQPQKHVFEATAECRTEDMQKWQRARDAEMRHMLNGEARNYMSKNVWDQPCVVIACGETLAESIFILCARIRGDVVGDVSSVWQARLRNRQYQTSCGA